MLEPARSTQTRRNPIEHVGHAVRYTASSGPFSFDLRKRRIAKAERTTTPESTIPADR